MSYVCEKILLNENGEKQYYINVGRHDTSEFSEKSISEILESGFVIENLDVKTRWLQNKVMFEKMMMARDALMKCKNYLDVIGQPEVVFSHMKDEIIVGIRVETELGKEVPFAVCCSNTNVSPYIAISYKNYIKAGPMDRVVTRVSDDVWETQEDVDKYIGYMMFACATTYREYSFMKAKKEHLFDFAEQTKDYLVERTKEFFKEENVTGSVAEKGKCCLVEISVKNDILDRVVVRILMHRFGWNVKMSAGYLSYKQREDGKLHTHLKTEKSCFRMPDEELEEYVKITYDNLVYEAAIRYHAIRLMSGPKIPVGTKTDWLGSVIEELNEKIEKL